MKPVLAVIILLTALIVSGTGLFWHPEGERFKVINQYGETIEMYGKGIYRHDTLFKAPILRGTDLTIFLVACPVLLFSMVYYSKKKSFKSLLLLNSVSGCFLYYAASVAFGVTYNSLHLLYILLFSSSLFSVISGFADLTAMGVKHSPAIPLKGIKVFLMLNGIALFVAWLPDIITALINKQPLSLIETYTTEITYVLDMGIIAPAAFICINLLSKKDVRGYIILDMFLTLCILIGFMLPLQTIFQLNAGIIIPPVAIITKVATFCVMAVFAIYYKFRFYNAIKE